MSGHILYIESHPLYVKCYNFFQSLLSREKEGGGVVKMC